MKQTKTNQTNSKINKIKSNKNKQNNDNSNIKYTHPHPQAHTHAHANTTKEELNIVASEVYRQHKEYGA